MSERLLFVCIPTRLLLEPPLAHRGSSDPRHRGTTSPLLETHNNIPLARRRPRP